MKGKVILVGAGPGDPGLLTLRGKECLEQADAVVYDNLIDTSILDWCRPSCRKIYVGKRGRSHAMEQPAINRLLIRLGKSGNFAVRLKGGDPFIFGRGGEEAEALAQAHIPFEVVPGVTSAVAVPAYAGVPLTHRLYSSMVSLVTGHEDPRKDSNVVLWRKLPPQGTLVILMGMENLKTIVQELLHRAWNPQTPIIIIQWGTFPFQRTLEGTLEDIVEKASQTKIGSPAIIVVGHVVSLRQKLAWFEKKPLFGRTIVVTRPQAHPHSALARSGYFVADPPSVGTPARAQASGFSKQLKELGAAVLEVPAIRIVPLAPKRLEQALAKLKEYDWLIFTSVNAVDIFAKVFEQKNISPAIKRLPRICAIGPKTKEQLERWGFSVTKVAKEYRAEAILPELGSVRGKRILLPRAQVARDVLPEELKKRGAYVDIIPLYKTVPDPKARLMAKTLLQKPVDCITFTSSSTVTHFLELFNPHEKRRLFQKAVAASIGPITTQTLKSHGIRPAITASRYTTAHLTQAILHYFSNGASHE